MIYECQNLSFSDIILENIVGYSNIWMVLYSQYFHFTNFTFSNVNSFSTFIIQIFFAQMNIENSTAIQFYPHLIHCSFGNLNVTNTVFRDSFDNQIETVQRVAIFLEDKNTFRIINCSFISLKNDINGVVKFEDFLGIFL